MQVLEQAVRRTASERRHHGLPKVFTEGFHCGDCGVSIHVSETHVVIDCEGWFDCQNRDCDEFNTSC